MLANEKNARVLQEKINDEQQRLQSHMQEESMKSTTERVSLTFSLAGVTNDCVSFRTNIFRLQMLL